MRELRGGLAAVLVLWAATVGAAQVAHEGFPDPADTSRVLRDLGGHSPTALSAAQVENGALLAGGFDVFVVGRMTATNGASARYVQAVGSYLAAGGNIVTEFSGVGMFLSAYASDVRPFSVMNTPQLGVFSGTLHAGGLQGAGTAIDILEPSHPTVTGLPDPFVLSDGADFMFWVQTADPNLLVVADFTGSGNMGFPRGQKLPVLLAGCRNGSSFVFGAWDWSDTMSVAGASQRFFLNSVAFASLGCNRPPVCEIAGPYSAGCQGAVTSLVLDGTGSSDPDGDALTFAWSTDCPQASFDDPSSPTPRLSVDTSAACSLVCTVTLMVQDATAVSICSTSVSIGDTLPPVLALNGAGLMVLEVRADVYVEPGATATDACDPQVAVSVSGQVDVNRVGTYRVTYGAQDRCGNAAAQVTRTVEVRDSIPPSFTSLPNDLTVECEGPNGVPSSNLDISDFLAAAQASDACDGEVGVTHDAPASFPMGDTLVTWRAQDLAGNPVTASRTVHVVDTAPPVMVTPANLTLQCPADTSVEATGSAAAMDVSGCSTVAVRFSDQVVAGCGGSFTLRRTWVAMDSSGNSTSEVQVIRVVDTAPPAIVLNGPAHLVLECHVEVYVEQGATATDGCDGPLEVVIGGQTVNTSVPGSYAVSYDAQDACGNSAVRMIRTVEVKDTIPPAFTQLPGDLTVECPGPEGVPSTHPDVAAFLSAPRASDTCDATVGITHDAPENFPGGDTLVTWTAVDLGGNPVTASRLVRVADTQPPVMVCPADVLAECPYDTSMELNGSATAVDNCGEVEVSHSDVLVPGCGNTETVHRTWTATDSAGNNATCVQVLRVVDTTAPVVLCSVLGLDKGRRVQVRFGASDACGPVAVYAFIDTGCKRIPVQDGESLQLTGGDFNCDGSSTLDQKRVGMLVVTAQDACGNSAVCRAEVPFHPDAGVETLQASFRRGDFNTDGQVAVSDVVSGLSYHMYGSPEPNCLDAADANDDGRVDMRDSLLVLVMLLYGHVQLPRPFPGVGHDPTADGLGCEEYLGAASEGSQQRRKEARRLLNRLLKDERDLRGLWLSLRREYRR